MKTKEELNALKEEVETLSKKLAELTEEELNQVTGGVYYGKPKSFDKENSHVNPEDSCKYGVCGSCEDYNGGKCTWGIV